MAGNDRSSLSASISRLSRDDRRKVVAIVASVAVVLAIPLGGFAVSMSRAAQAREAAESTQVTQRPSLASHQTSVSANIDRAADVVDRDLVMRVSSGAAQEACDKGGVAPSTSGGASATSATSSSNTSSNTSTSTPTNTSSGSTTRTSTSSTSSSTRTGTSSTSSSSSNNNNNSNNNSNNNNNNGNNTNNNNNNNNNNGNGSSSTEPASLSGGGESPSEQPFSTTDFSDTVVIGDSVVAGSKESIEAALPGVTVDADPSRTFEHGGAYADYSDEDGMIDYAREVAGKYRRYVIECGINDAGLTRDMADSFLGVLARDGAQVYFVNQLVTDNQESNEITRSTIDAVCEGRTDVFCIDWLGKGDESDLADDCHLNTDGCEHYASLIHDVIVEHVGA